MTDQGTLRSVAAVLVREFARNQVSGDSVDSAESYFRIAAAVLAKLEKAGWRAPEAA
jgi:hypothetical protein